MDIPDDLNERLDELTPRQLDDIARTAERKAEEQRRQNRIEQKEENGDEEAADPCGDPLPNDVPAKATLTKKTINDNEYWYWQWREGDEIKSKYKEPVSGTI